MELVAFYNVENFFLPDPKPVHFMDPTASGLRNWDAKRYQNKLHKMAHVLDLFQKEKGKLPFIVGLAEIADKKVLEDLLSKETYLEVYEIIHFNSMDERGVDVALLYDKTKLELLHTEPISFVFEINDEDLENYDTTRDLLHAKFLYGDKIINTFVLHLPSKREKDVNKPKRKYILEELNKKVIDLVYEKNEAVIISGDFNENPTEENIQAVLYHSSQKVLENPFEDVYEKNIFSTFHRKDGLLFDQIWLSPHFFQNTVGLTYKEAGVFSPDEIKNWDKKYRGRPFRTYVGTRYLGGYSDHFPVYVKLETSATQPNLI